MSGSLDQRNPTKCAGTSTMSSFLVATPLLLMATLSTFITARQIRVLASPPAVCALCWLGLRNTADILRREDSANPAVRLLFSIHAIYSVFDTYAGMS